VPGCAEETAYYLNGKLPQLALIAKGVRFPPGNWLRVAEMDVVQFEKDLEDEKKGLVA